MVDATHISFAANDRSYFSLVKKEIHQRGKDAGMPDEKLNAIDLIVAEMTSNLFKYSDDGEILMGTFANEGNPYVEIICIDNGPGMSNPAKMLIDGVSTSNTLGHGLGSIKRLSDDFDLYSQVDWGTIVLSRVYNKPVPNALKKAMTVQPIVVSKPGEKVSGDGFVWRKTGKHIKLMLADGLGHGPEANLAVNEAAAAFRICPDENATEILRFLHSSIKRTRGAVMHVAIFNTETKSWSISGIGNIAVRLIGPVAVKNHMSYNGIVGHNIPGTMNDQAYPAEQFNKIILCSDGIKTRWDLTKYPLIQKHDLAILAAAIYKDHARRTDDMSVIVAKIN
jgi:anti-sigma regulatory factor (Ser/Thr protein kinase)